MKRIDAARLAGLFENNGCIRMKTNRRKSGTVSRYPEIDLRLQDEELVSEVADILDVHYNHRYRQTDWADCDEFKIQFYGSKAEKALSAMLPFFLTESTRQRVAEILWECDQ